MEKNSLKRKSHVVLKVFKSGENVLFDLKTRKTYKLNDVGMRIWSLLDGTRSVEDIAMIMAEEFDASVETIRNDSKALIEQMLSLGIVEV